MTQDHVRLSRIRQQIAAILNRLEVIKAQSRNLVDSSGRVISISRARAATSNARRAMPKPQDY